MKALAFAYLAVMCVLGIASVVNWAGRVGATEPAAVIALTLSMLTGLAVIALIPDGSDE